MPLTQIVLADAAGMTPVHVNRVTAALRKAGAMELEGGGLTIDDLGKLARIAGLITIISTEHCGSTPNRSR